MPAEKSKLVRRGGATRTCSCRQEVGLGMGALAGSRSVHAPRFVFPCRAFVAFMMVVVVWSIRYLLLILHNVVCASAICFGRYEARV